MIGTYLKIIFNQRTSFPQAKRDGNPSKTKAIPDKPE